MDSSDIGRAVDALRDGALVIVPTDTVYGVAADAGLPDAEARIYEAKKRDRGKPIPLLAADADAVRDYGAALGVVETRLAEKFWPGPLTMVLDMGDRDRSGNEGFRVPDHEQARELLRAAGGVLRVTSANESGQPPALTAAAAKTALGDHVAVVLDAGPAPGGTASTVIRVENTGDGPEIVILREGAVAAAELEKFASTRRSGCRTGQ